MKVIMLSIFNGHLYAVTIHHQGHYCGYVRCEENEKSFFDKAYAEYEETCNVSSIICHGGVTFISRENGEWILPEGNWIGFDCAHSRDGKDFLMVEKVFGKKAAEIARDMHYDDGKDTKITPKMVSAICKDMIGQIIEANKTK